MKTKKKLTLIIGLCLAAVMIISVYSLWKTFRPSRGLRYEQLTMEKAQEYMEYEIGYVIVDIRPAADFEKEHLPGAVSLPLEDIGQKAPDVLPDPQQMIYVYGADGKDSCQAAQKLFDMEYKNITEIGSMGDWKEPSDGTEEMQKQDPQEEKGEQ